MESFWSKENWLPSFPALLCSGIKENQGEGKEVCFGCLFSTLLVMWEYQKSTRYSAPLVKLTFQLQREDEWISTCKSFI